MTTRTVPQQHRHRRKLREATSSFKALISAPHDLSSGPLVMPGPARLALSSSVALTEAEVTITVEGGRSWTHKALAADAVALGNWTEDNARVTQVGAPVATLSIRMVDPLDGKTKVIATLVVA